jgi:multidrug efflux pump subunit AcrB
VNRIRARLHTDFPDITPSFPPADIVAQILNFGLPSPLDIQIVGANKSANGALANRLVERIRRIPGAVDVRVQQPFDYPRLNVNVDRSKASDVGISET